jgi:hypothetical protein
MFGKYRAICKQKSKTSFERALVRPKGRGVKGIGRHGISAVDTLLKERLLEKSIVISLTALGEARDKIAGQKRGRGAILLNLELKFSDNIFSSLSRLCVAHHHSSPKQPMRSGPICY